MDFRSYPDWNPFIKEILGNPRPGEILEVLMEPFQGRPQKFKPRVLVVEALREFRWKGSLPIPGLFEGEHYFKIEPLAAGKTRFTQGENFKGFLVPLAGSFLQDKVLPAFEAMNQALQKRTETLGMH